MASTEKTESCCDTLSKILGNIKNKICKAALECLKNKCTYFVTRFNNINLKLCSLTVKELEELNEFKRKYYVAHPYVYVYNSGDSRIVLNNLYRGFLESDAALYLSNAPDRRKEFSTLTIVTRDDSEYTQGVLNDVYKELQDNDIYDTLNIRYVFQINYDPVFVSLFLTYVTDVVLAQYTVKEFTVVYENHPQDTIRRYVQSIYREIPLSDIYNLDVFYDAVNKMKAGD